MSKPRFRIINLSVLIFLLAAVPAMAQVKLTYLGAGGAPYQVLAQELVDTFNARNEDIEVELVWVVGAAADLLEKLQVMVIADTAPDVFWTHVYLMQDIVHQNIALPLDGLIAADADFELDEYFPVAVNEYRLNNMLYGMPSEVTSLAMFYNIDLFNNHGVGYPDATWDWEILKQNAKKLTSGNDSTKTWGFFPPNGHANAYAVTWQNGGQFFDETRTKPLFDQPDTVEAHQWIADLMYVDQVSPPGGVVEGGLYQAFGNSRLAMFYDIPGAATWLQTAAATWDVVPLPQGKEMANRIATSGMSITATTAHPEESWRFLKYMISEEVQAFYLERGFVIPTYRPLANSAEFLQRYNRPQNTMAFLEGLEYARNEEITRNYISVLGAKNNALLPLWRGEAPAASVMQEVNKAVLNALP